MATTAAVLNILVNVQTGTASAKLRKFDGQLRATEGTANRSTGALGKFAKAAKLAGVAVGAGAAYGLFKGVTAGAAFEKQMDSLGSVAQATGKQMGKFEKQALALGESTQFTANEVAKAQTELAKGGLTVKQIYGGGIKSALALAAAGELELGQAAETTVNAMKLFGLEGKNSMKVANALATAANKTTADVGDFALALRQGGGVAKLAGMNFNETVTVLEALAEAGYKGSDAGTSLKSFFINIGTPSVKAKKMMEELGLSIFNAKGQLKDLPALSKNLKEAFGDLTEQQFLEQAGTIAGSDAIRSLYALYEAGPQKLKALEQANARHGTALKVAAEKTDNLTGDTEELGGALETKAIQGFKNLSPYLRDAVQGLTDFVRSSGSFNAQEIAAKLGIGQKEFKKFQEAARNAADIFNKYVKPTIQTVLEICIRLLKDFAKVVRGVVRIIVGILTLDLGMAWKGVKDIFEGGIDGILAMVKGISKPIRTVIAALGQGMGKAWEKVWSGISGIFSDGVDAIAGFIQNIADIINPLLDAVGIGEIHIVSEGKNAGKDVNGKSQGRQRGGMMFGGKPSGDSIPALLERGEYVLNKNAVKAMGAKHLDAINFGAASRFQKGGPVEMSIGGDVWGAVKDVAGYSPAGLAYKGGKAALNTAGDLTKGASYFINGLPGMGGTGFFPEIGNALAGKVADWIGGLPKSVFGGGSKPGLSGGKVDTPLNFAKYMIEAGFPKTVQALSEGLGIIKGESNYLPNNAQGPGGHIGPWAESPAFGSVKTREDPRGSTFAAYRVGWKPTGSFHQAWGQWQEQQGGYNGATRWGPEFEDEAARALGMVGKAKGGLMGMTGGGTAGKKGNPFNPLLMSGSPTSGPKPLAGESGFLPKTIGRIKNKAAAIAAAFEGYVYGGGHGEGTNVMSNKIDCSSAVAKLLQRSGWTDFSVGVSGEYESIFQPGEGDLFTIWSNAGHTFAEIENKMWGTNSSTGLGYHSHTTAGFVPRHPILGAGGEGGGGGMTSGQETKAEAAATKRNREAQAKQLRAMVGKTKTKLGKKTALWDLVSYFGKFGMFKDEETKKHVLDQVLSISSLKNPLMGIPGLNRLAAYMEKKVPLSGRDEGNFPSLEDKIKEAREKGATIAERKRNKAFRKIEGKGALNKTQAQKLADFSTGIETLEEQIGIKEGWASSESGPAGSDWNDAEAAGIISLNEGLLANLGGKRGLDAGYLAMMRERQEKVAAAIKAAQPKNAQTHWKLPALRGERDKIRETIADLSEDLKDLQGVTGEGGRINDVKLALANMGATVSGAGSEESSDRAARLEELLRQANQRNLIFERVNPLVDAYSAKNFAGMFAKGGSIPAGQWGIVGENGPEPAFGPVDVFPNGTQFAAQSPTAMPTVNVEVRVLDGAVDTDKIEVIATGAAVKVTKAQGRRSKLSSGRTGKGV